MTLRAGQYLAGEGYCKGPEPTLTERSDLKSGRAGWNGVTKGTERRVREKLGPVPMGSDTHMLTNIPWGGSVEKRRG